MEALLERRNSAGQHVDRHARLGMGGGGEEVAVAEIEWASH